jgi:hypothetical protein
VSSKRILIEYTNSTVDDEVEMPKVISRDIWDPTEGKEI